MTEVINHLWQSTLFAILVDVVAFAFRRNQAQTRYRLWLAASVKFLIPFSLLVSLGSRVEVPAAAPVVGALAVEQIATSFSPISPPHTAAPQPGTPAWPKLLAALWLAGVIVILVRWFRRWLLIRSVVRGAAPLPLDAPIPVLSSRSSIEPGVFGIFRPVLLLPAGITEELSAEELDAILAHELSHVRRRDNLTAALHMLVEALFWFHPLVWWIEARLVEERERACDEAVLNEGLHPHVYARGILNVCRFFVESPLPCASGVTGSDLKRRIQEIMTRRVSMRLTITRKLILSIAVVAIIAVPLAIGVLRAQALPPPPSHTYEVVSIRPATPGEQNSRLGPGPQGGMRTQNTTVMQLLTFAFDAREYQFASVPGWVRAARFDVSFTPDKPEFAPEPGMARDQLEGLFNRHRQRMQAILRDRLGLVMHVETKELPVYALTVAKNGHKLAPPANTSPGPNMSVNRAQITATGAYLKMLTDALSGLLSRPVTNETGLDGPYDFKLQWTVDSSVQLEGKLPRPNEPAHAEDVGGTSIFTALQEQLGLKLESKKGPVPVFVIEKLEKPTEN